MRDDDAELYDHATHGDRDALDQPLQRSEAATRPMLARAMLRLAAGLRQRGIDVERGHLG